MQTISIPITLSDDTFELARKQGLLESETLSGLVRDAVGKSPEKKPWEWPEGVPLPEGVPPELAKFVHPKLYGKGKTLGNIISPIDVEWEAMQ
ncbi:MAG TPA: hypothetical protein DEB39_15240 [Planctomycetaceae bacterium]|nr:hypothetical protein [Planctomycetaceae bacterium]